MERATVYTDRVERGEMVRQVRRQRRLAREEIRWIPAATSGMVERIRVEPGVVVHPDTILVELSNPELEQQTEDAALAVRPKPNWRASRCGSKATCSGNAPRRRD